MSLSPPSSPSRFTNFPSEDSRYGVLNTVYTVGVSYSNRRGVQLFYGPAGAVLTERRREVHPGKVPHVRRPDRVPHAVRLRRRAETAGCLSRAGSVGATERSRPPRRHASRARARTASTSRRCTPTSSSSNCASRSISSSRGGGFRRGGVRGERRVVSRRRGGGAQATAARAVLTRLGFDAVARCASR